MAPKVDYGAIEERDFSPVPNGIYEARFTKGELVPPKTEGKFPYYNCEYTLEGEGVANRKVWKILSLSPQSLWAFKSDMVRLGADVNDMAPGSDVDTDDIIAAVTGAECRLSLKETKYRKNSDAPGEPDSGLKNEIVEVLAVGVPA